MEEDRDNANRLKNSDNAKLRNSKFKATCKETTSSPTISDFKIDSSYCALTGYQHETHITSKAGGRTIRMQSLEEDNNRLRERVAHVEHLEVLSADAEEQKLKLIEENLALRKRLDQLEQILMEKQIHAKRIEPGFISKSANDNLSLLETTRFSSQVFPSLQEEFQTMIKTTHENNLPSQNTERHVASDDDVIKVASLFLSQAAGTAHNSPKQEVHERKNAIDITDDHSAETRNDYTEKKRSESSNDCTSRLTSTSEIDTIQSKPSGSVDDKRTHKCANEKTDVSHKESRKNTSEKTDKREINSSAVTNECTKLVNPDKDRTIEHREAKADRTLPVHHRIENEMVPEKLSCVAETKFDQEIQQLEDMIQRQVSVDSSSENEASMTFQFTKIAAVFASLAQRVVKSQKQAKNSEVNCDALATENITLRSQLKAYKQQLEEAKLQPKHTTTTATQTLEESTKSDTEELVTKLQARVKKLEKQREEILRVNKNWDTQYKKLREELDKRTAISTSGDACTTRDLPGSSKESPRTCEGEKSNSATRHQAAKQIQALKHEMAKLRLIVSEVESEKRCLIAENARLNQALEATYSVYERRSLVPRQEKNDFHLPPYSDNKDVSCESSVVEELRTHVEVLQEQVKIYREDFETERKDRERSQSEKQKMQEALARSRREVQTLTQQARTHEAALQRERKDKEKAQRQLKQCQRNQPREASGSRRRDRYYGETTDPPTYQGHRRVDPANSNYSPTNTAGNRRRSRQAYPLYDATANDLWFEGDSPEDEAIPQSPRPDDLD